MQFIAVRSCEEFEGEYLRLLEELYKRPILPVGVLPPVLFVGFGSEYKMPVEQIHELAFSLELSELPFLWILRKPQDVDSSDLLPPGFANRTRTQGIVLLGWAPQLEILAHPAIGGCLFHAGWGTIIESLAFGHPLVLLPMILDQGLNAKLSVEKEVGYEVPRNEDGSFSREAVAEYIRGTISAEG